MDDRMLDGDRVLWFIGGSPERAQEALAAGHAWTPEQRAQLEQIAASAGYSPQQPAGYPPAQQQVPVQLFAFFGLQHLRGIHYRIGQLGDGGQVGGKQPHAGKQHG